MKNLPSLRFFIAIFAISFTFLNCANENQDTRTTQKPQPQPVTETDPKSVLDTLVMPLDDLVSVLSAGTEDPYLGEEIKAFINAYWDIKNEMESVVLASGLRIDFVGITHHSFGEDQSGVLESQAKLAKLLHKKKWDVIGYEGSSKLGFVDKEELLQETKYQLAAIGMDTALASVAFALKTNRSGDLLQSYVEQGWKNIAGTERAEVWHLQQKIGFLVDGARNEGYRGLLESTTTPLNQVRSTIALVRVAKIMKMYNLKHGVIVYGGNHLYDFTWLQSKFDTKSEFFPL